MRWPDALADLGNAHDRFVLLSRRYSLLRGRARAPLRHAHQRVLEVLSETGVLGLLLWIAGIAMADAAIDLDAQDIEIDSYGPPDGSLLAADTNDDADETLASAWRSAVSRRAGINACARSRCTRAAGHGGHRGFTRSAAVRGERHREAFAECRIDGVNIEDVDESLRMQRVGATTAVPLDSVDASA